jgi:stage V sporulation protein SpoVS
VTAPGLSDRQLRLYARQVIVAEIGRAGQERLCASSVAIAPDADVRAAAVTRDYLQRAGLSLSELPESTQLDVPGSAEVRAAAGEPELESCAAWLLGAWAAVEALKEQLGVGRPAPTLPGSDAEVF